MSTVAAVGGLAAAPGPTTPPHRGLGKPPFRNASAALALRPKPGSPVRAALLAAVANPRTPALLR